VKKLRGILRYLGTATATWKKGNLRADVNVSVRRPGAELGTRCRDLKRQFLPLNPASNRIRGPAASRHSRGRRTIRQEDAPVRSGQGRDRPMRFEEEAQRLPLFPRSGPAAAGARSGLDQADRGRPAGIAGRQADAAGGAVWPVDYDAGVAGHRNQARPTISRAPRAATPSWWPTG